MCHPKKLFGKYLIGKSTNVDCDSREESLTKRVRQTSLTRHLWHYIFYL